jgi:hypothetical protein
MTGDDRDSEKLVGATPVDSSLGCALVLIWEIWLSVNEI